MNAGNNSTILTRDALLEALRGTTALHAEPKTDLARPRRRAAVLCPIVEREAGLGVILTRRSIHLPTHAGQISFPGGKIDPEDHSPLRAALREAEEEIGLFPHQVDILGMLDLYDTRTGFLVTPFVGLVDPAFAPVPEPGEVDEVFEVPLDFIANHANHNSVIAERDGRKRQYYEILYGNYRIWGATAGMLRDLCERLWRIGNSSNCEDKLGKPKDYQPICSG